MGLEKKVLIAGRAGEASLMMNSLSHLFESTHDADIVRILPATTHETLRAGIDARPDVVVYDDSLPQAWGEALRGVHRDRLLILYTHSKPSSAASLSRPPSLEDRTHPFYAQLGARVYDALTGLSSESGHLENLGVIGTGKLGHALAHAALSPQTGIRRFYLFNGRNSAKAQLLAESLQQKILGSSFGGSYEVVVVNDVRELKFECGIIAYTIGNEDAERTLRGRKRQRTDFLKLYLESTLEYSKKLTGYTGNLVCVTNPVSLLLYVLYAGSYREPNQYDARARYLIPEGLYRGIQALLEMGKRVGCIPNDNGISRESAQGIDLSLVGPRDRFIITRPTIKGRSLSEIRKLARGQGLPPSDFTLKALRKRIVELGVGRVREAEGYFAEYYTDRMLDHIRAIRGTKSSAKAGVIHPAVAHVDLLTYSDLDRARSCVGVNVHGSWQQLPLVQAYRQQFPNDVITGWDVGYNDRFPFPLFVALHEEKKTRNLFTALTYERDVLLEALGRTSEDFYMQVDQVRRFFTEPFPGLKTEKSAKRKRDST
jgi:hypothetical protein